MPYDIGQAAPCPHGSRRPGLKRDVPNPRPEPRKGSEFAEIQANPT